MTTQSTLSPHAVQQVLDKRQREAAQAERMRLDPTLRKLEADIRTASAQFPDLSNPLILDIHMRLLTDIANHVVLAPQKRKFVIDDHNRLVILFLLHYFNNSPIAETIFPDKRYKLAKPLILRGDKGVGKTLLMQLFSEYLRRTNNPNFFFNVSVTEMVNYYTINNNLNRYTYNDRSGIKEDNTFDGCRPSNVCLNDIGITTQTFFGQNTKQLVTEFLHARYEIWTQWSRRGHLTTNLTPSQLAETFTDPFQRTNDRFKSYNIITLTGTSRR